MSPVEQFSVRREPSIPSGSGRHLTQGEITMRHTRRSLPSRAEEIVWFVALCARKLAMMVSAIGMALFRDKHIVDVARLLESATTDR
jgi:hypothetical protein